MAVGSADHEYDGAASRPEPAGELACKPLAVTLVATFIERDNHSAIWQGTEQALPLVAPPL